MTEARECGTRAPRHTGVVPAPQPAFARDDATAAYYDQRAGEYDEWYLGAGQFAERDRPGWTAEVNRVLDLMANLTPAHTIDIACGTGFLTRHLHGTVVGVDRSPAMAALTQSRLPDGVAVVADALALPFADNAFDRVFTAHFYGHLPTEERQAFLTEARRVAGELIVVDSAWRPGVEAEQWQERILNDGSRHRVYKRYLTAGQLAHELGGDRLFQGTWFVAARVRRR